jgi:hypothetical protein
MVGAEIARTGCGQALSARERAAPGTDFIRLAQNIASSEIATVTPSRRPPVASHHRISPADRWR